MDAALSAKPQIGETRVTPWIAYGHYGYTHYRIWDKFTSFGMMQRHEWRHEDGTEDCENWRPAMRNEWCENSTPAAEH